MCCHAALEDALIFVEIANSSSEMSPAFNLLLRGQYGTLTLVRPRLLNRDLAYPRLPWQQAACDGIGPGWMVTWKWGTSTLITFDELCVSGCEIERGLGEPSADIEPAALEVIVIHIIVCLKKKKQALIFMTSLQSHGERRRVYKGQRRDSLRTPQGL